MARLIDSEQDWLYASRKIEEAVRSNRWLMLLCLFSAIALFMMAPMDTPATGFNEIDTPLALSHPRLPQFRLVPPSIASHVAEDLRPLQAVRILAALPFEQDKYTVRAGELQNLLCVFLI